MNPTTNPVRSELPTKSYGSSSDGSVGKTCIIAFERTTLRSLNYNVTLDSVQFRTQLP